MDCCLTNTDAHITGGSEDGFIYFWDLVDASVVSNFRAHASVVSYSLYMCFGFTVVLICKFFTSLLFNWLNVCLKSNITCFSPLNFLMSPVSFDLLKGPEGRRKLRCLLLKEYWKQLNYA